MSQEVRKGNNVYSNNNCGSDNLDYTSSNNLDGTVSSNKKNQPLFDVIMKYREKLNINYIDYDSHKGELSPRQLFKKRKIELTDSSNLNGLSNLNSSNNNINNLAAFSNFCKDFNSSNNSQTSLMNANQFEDKSKGI